MCSYNVVQQKLRSDNELIVDAIEDEQERRDPIDEPQPGCWSNEKENRRSYESSDDEEGIIQATPKKSRSKNVN